jgi:hypothetical protein
MSQAVKNKRTLPDLMWIKIWIIYNHCICCVEVDANTTSTSGKQVYEIFRIWAIELIHAFLSDRLFRRAVLERS